VVAVAVVVYLKRQLNTLTTLRVILTDIYKN